VRHGSPSRPTHASRMHRGESGPPPEGKGGGGCPVRPGAGRAVPFPDGGGTARRPVCPRRPHLGEARFLGRRAGGAGRFCPGNPREGRPVRASPGRGEAPPGQAGVRRPPVGQADRVRVPRRRSGLRRERADQRRPCGGEEGPVREGVGVHDPAVQPLPEPEEAPDRRGRTRTRRGWRS